MPSPSVPFPSLLRKFEAWDVVVAIVPETVEEMKIEGVVEVAVVVVFAVIFIPLWCIFVLDPTTSVRVMRFFLRPFSTPFW